MKISIIVSTYNSPDALEKVLWGYSNQMHTSFEIVVADDGSTSETADVIESARRETGLRLRHVWQEDEGFEKCRILNRATASAQAEYLIYTDGDCVPRSDFVAVHARLARRGFFLSGGCIHLDAVATGRLTVDHVRSGQAFQRSWLDSQAARPHPKSYRLALKGSWAGLADRLTVTRATFNGHNASVWKADVVAVNGFDERMRYGGLDRELGERLVNHGVRGRQVRHRAIVLHLHHDRPYRTASGRADNDRIRNDNRRSGAVWTEYGLDKWLNTQEAGNEH